MIFPARRSRVARSVCGLAVLGAWIGGTSLPGAAGGTRSYHIGNSLTWDSHPLGVAALARTQGFDHEAGYHIRCNSSLNGIVANPFNSCISFPTPYLSFSTALEGFAWTAVTMQPYPMPGVRSTLGTDARAVLDLIDLTRRNPANSATTFYVFATWPDAWNYDAAWNREVADSPETPTVPSREYFDLLVDRVRGSTDARVGLIPLGEVFYRLGLRMEAGDLPGWESRDALFRDGRHLTQDAGSYVAAAAVYATLFGFPPHGLSKPPGLFGEAASFSAEFEALVHDTVWDVVSTHPAAIRMTADADFDRDGRVAFADQRTWETRFGVDAIADFDRDGTSSGLDLLGWQRASPGPRPAPADFNRDQRIDADDAAVWEAAFGNGPAGDANRDGRTGGSDLLAWQLTQMLSAAFVADFSADGRVDADDMLRWEAAYGAAYGAVDGTGADADADQRAGGSDLLAWQRFADFPEAAWAATAATSLSVPEPVSAALLTAGCVAVLVRGRGRRTRCRRG